MKTLEQNTLDKLPLEVLKDVFGYTSFRLTQKEVIENAINGQDTLVIMPTGGGKSLCYQIPALILPHLTIVVSPLIALMKDQVTALQTNGVSTAYFNSTLSASEKSELLSDIREEKIKILYIAPESLFSETITHLLSEITCSLIAIDEAHCISVWGNDFRPEYTRLSKLRQNYPDVPLMALTATADEATRNDILQQLNIPDAHSFVESFERENISIVARPGLSRIEHILLFLKSYKGQSGIIYCLSRKNAEKVAEKLSLKGHKASYYHAGMDSTSRHRVQREFQNDELHIICATIAFGMGIDKADVRFVIHYNMPKNIEGFYQEIGRSGRDGQPAESLLFYSWSDMVRLRSFIEDSPANETFKKIQLAKLERIWEFANASSCRSNLILNYFGEFTSGPCGRCDNCLNPPQSFDGTILTQKVLSVIVRTHQKVGMNLLIDILRGSHKQEIRQNEFDKIKTFGAGRDVPYVEWKHFITQMLNKGLIAIDYTQQSRLMLTPFSQPVLKGERQVNLVKYLKEQSRQKRVTKKELIESELFVKLKSWRTEISKQKNMPAYAILNDRTLRDLAERKPIMLSALIEINGIGQVKYEQYGEAIIEVIREYLRTQEISKQQKGQTYLQTLHLYKQSMSAGEIAKMRNLNELTILNHLSILYENGEAIEIGDFLSVEDLETIKQAWLKLDSPQDLKPVYIALKGRMEYYQIRFGVLAAKKALAEQTD